MRKEAFEILCQVLINDGYASLLMRTRLEKYDEMNRAFITQLVYGVLENYYFLNYQWQEFKQGDLPLEIEILINMSVYQFLMLDKVPDYANVNETVEIAKRLFHGKYSKVVNAILRNCMRQGSKEVTGSIDEVLSINTSHPLWLVKMWISHYGLETATKLCEFSLITKLMAGRVNTMVISKKDILANSLFTDGKLAPEAVYYQGNLLLSEQYKKHQVFIQDEASQMVAHLVNPQKGESILDMCASPGTKAIQLAQMTDDELAIICLDIHKHRVKLITDSVDELKLKSISAKCIDAREASREFEPSSFDVVLLDAPCSGLGVLAQKPDLKLRIKPSDIDEIVRLQQELLTSGAMMVKNGGRLIYSTCTLNKKENEKQIEWFCQKHPNFRLVSEKTYFPMDYDTDGFYMTKLMKVSE